MLPFGNALIGVPSTMVCWEHFPNKRGVVSGFISMGFGLGSFFFGFLTSAVFDSVANKTKYTYYPTGEEFFI